MRTFSSQHKTKLSLAKIGRPSNAQGKCWRIKDRSNMKGGSHNKGKGNQVVCLICCQLFFASLSLIKRGNGKFCSKECYSISISGENSHSWKGGVTSLSEKIRKSIEYKNWRKAVFERDNYTCQECSQHGGNLEADHIKQFAYFPELRFELSNGRTLCRECHRKTETYGFSRKITIIKL